MQSCSGKHVLHRLHLCLGRTVSSKKLGSAFCWQGPVLRMQMPTLH